MKWRVIKKEYTDGTTWYYLQERNWLGRWKQLGYSDHSEHWMGWDTLEKAMGICTILNNPVTVKSKTIIYPYPVKS